MPTILGLRWGCVSTYCSKRPARGLAAVRTVSVKTLNTNAIPLSAPGQMRHSVVYQLLTRVLGLEDVGRESRVSRTRRRCGTLRWVSVVIVRHISTFSSTVSRRPRRSRAIFSCRGWAKPHVCPSTHDTICSPKSGAHNPSHRVWQDGRTLSRLPLTSSAGRTETHLGNARTIAAIATLPELMLRSCGANLECCSASKSQHVHLSLVASRAQLCVAGKSSDAVA